MWASIMLVFVASRLLVCTAGLAGMAGLGSGKRMQSGNVQRDWSGPPLLEMWARWDSEWYLLIAGRGYHLEAEMARRRVSYQGADATGFFPLYPLAVRAAAGILALVPGVDRIPILESDGRATRGPGDRRASLLLAAVLVSNLALLGSLLLIARRAARAPVHRPPPGPRAPLAACMALLAFPSSMFLSAVYAESLLLFLVLLTFELLSARRWWAAGIAAALASAAKPAGLFLVLPAALALLGEQSALRNEGRSGTRWLSLALYPAGAAIFSWYCRREFGDPLSWLHRQERWRGAVSGPWRAFARWWEGPQIHGAHHSTVELILALFALALLLAVFRRRPAAESAFAAAIVVLPLCSTLWSFGRLSVQAFPIFIVLGGWAAARPRISLAYFVPATAGGMVMMAYFSAWWWAG